MPRTLRVSLVQFGLDAESPQDNLAYMKRHVADHAGSDLIVFPELALHGHGPQEGGIGMLRRAVRAVEPRQIAELDEVVAAAGTSVVYGKLVEEDGRLHNRATFTDGRHSVSYSKTHVHWTEPYAAGDGFPLVRAFAVPLGMLICFDAAFPEVPRILALRGAQIIVNISAIPEHFPLRIVHRRLVACSVENQVFTLFANRAGEGYKGGSAVVDPEGEILAVAGEHPTVLTVDLDLDRVAQWRAQEPTFPHRRPDLYGDLTKPFSPSVDDLPGTPK